MSSGVNGLYLGDALARRARARHLYNEHRPVGVELSSRRRVLLRLAARGLDGVIAVSDDQRPEWVARGVAAARVHIIANGIRADAHESAREPARAELGIGASAVVALCVATLKPVKRVGDFVSAVRAARERVPELVGLVAGDGPDRGALEASLAGAGGPGEAGVRLLGAREDVPRLMRAADLFVLPSDREAMPMAILEAMAYGLPVLATPVGAVREMLGNGEAGLLFEPGDRRSLTEHLERLARDPELRARLGAAARRRVAARWSVATMVERYEQVFAAALATARR
jgi:glycosyltransferase involved in cell wall biosynthesis